MTLEEWRKQFCFNGVPNFVPAVEVNPLPDMCTPKIISPLAERTGNEPAPAQFDGLTIKDMQDSQFMAAVKGPNKFIRMDEGIRYQRMVGEKFSEFRTTAKKKV
ncbi:putative VP5 [Microviridae sp.]|nr:putative VP5 [Microviridae sp.]